MNKSNIIYDNVFKNKQTEKIVDYLKETAFLADKEAEEDDSIYYDFFNTLYDLCVKKNEQDKYYSIASQYICTCTCKCDTLYLKDMYDNLNLLLKCCILLKSHINILDINKIKKLEKQKHQKVLKLN